MKSFVSKLSLIAISVLILVSCSQLQQFIGADPEPPEDYDPVFIEKTKQIPAGKIEYFDLRVSYTDPYQGSKVRHFIHLTEDGNIYLTGAASPDKIKNWCKVIDVCNGEAFEITDFKITEVIDSKRQAQAIALVMDHSGSMGDRRARDVQQAVVNFLTDSKETADMVTLIKYDDHVEVEVPLTSNKSTLLEEFLEYGLEGYGKGTATLDAISAGIEEVSKAPADLKRVVMVFTDGADINSSKTIDEIIEQARNTNTIVCAIDYGVMIQEEFLEKIAQSTNGTYDHIYASEEFNLVFKDLYYKLKTYYLLEYTAPCFGEHEVMIKYCHNDVTIEGESEYDNTPYSGLKTVISVQFDTGKSKLKKKSNEAVEYIYMMMKSSPNIVIELRGHTDATGNARKNMNLSQKRADAVRNALISKGINRDRISAKGFGDTQPIATNDTPAGRAENRRTEVVVTYK